MDPTRDSWENPFSYYDRFNSLPVDWSGKENNREQNISDPSLKSSDIKRLKKYNLYLVFTVQCLSYEILYDMIPTRVLGTLFHQYHHPLQQHIAILEASAMLAATVLHANNNYEYSSNPLAQLSSPKLY